VPATPPLAEVGPLPSYTLEGSDRARLRDTEWLLTNGLGGFAMGTPSGVPTRRYHGLLVGSISPPVQREVLLHSLVDMVVLDPGAPNERRLDLAAFKFRGGAEHPKGYELIGRFVKGTSCRWLYRAGELEITKTLRFYRGTNAVAVTYKVRPGNGIMRLELRPLVAMRNAHSLRSKDAAGGYIVEPGQRSARVHHYGRTLDLETDAGCFDRDEQWWYGFEYDHERDRGYDFQEDLFSPGVFSLQARPRAEINLTLIAWVDEKPGDPLRAEAEAAKELTAHAESAMSGVRADAMPEDRAAVMKLVAAAEDFVVRRGAGPEAGASIIAGYPWFSDWGRDSAISLPGLLLSTRRFTEARQVLETFARTARTGSSRISSTTAPGRPSTTRSTRRCGSCTRRASIEGRAGTAPALTAPSGPRASKSSTPTRAGPTMASGWTPRTG
jgi:predicted glycogen debranching enzyme